MPEEIFSCRFTFFVSRNKHASQKFSPSGYSHPCNNYSTRLKKEKSHEETKGNAVDGGNHSGSGRRGGGSACGLLLFCTMLRFVFRL